MAREPLVSVIIPVYNRPARLREAVASVLAQTYRPIEVIIIDDGSVDDTGSVADELAMHEDVLVIHQPNAGVGLAREAGRLASNGAFIQHLDSDDVLYPSKLELQVAGLLAHPECGVSYGWTRLRMHDGSLSPAPARRSGERIDTMFPSMLQSRWWHTPTPLYRAELIERAGPWLPLINEEDWEYDARIAAMGVRLHYTADWICEFRHHEAPRLSGQGRRPAVLRDRAIAHDRILAHARAAGITTEVPEMRNFARELFLLARQCGAAGLDAESQRLFDLARDASGAERDRIQFRAYRAAAALFGWTAAGRAAELMDRLRW